jgi:hypothetical protein
MILSEQLELLARTVCCTTDCKTSTLNCNEERMKMNENTREQPQTRTFKTAEQLGWTFVGVWNCDECKYSWLSDDDFLNCPECRSQYLALAAHKMLLEDLPRYLAELEEGTKKHREAAIK